MRIVHQESAGIDIGAKQFFVSTKDKVVKSFYTFTSDIISLGNYLKSKKVESVAMEATGVYWYIIYEILEEKFGIDVWLVDGRQTKQVPGRKTDVKDCQWIQELHSYGLLNRCHVTTGDLKSLRTYQRLREDHIETSSMHINHMQKALTIMNIRLKEVLSQIHGKSGLSMIVAMLDGERNRNKLLSLCHISVKKNKSELILKALEGHYTEEGLFTLKQAYQGYEFYQKRLEECDKKISEILNKINENDPLSTGKRKAIRHHKPDVDNLGGHLLKIFGNHDATVISGVTDYSWLRLLGEIGVDLAKWKTEKHFTSWLGLSPGQHHSGKMRRNKKKGRPKAGQIFRMIAFGLLNSKDIALGAFGRKLRAKKGAALAIKAVARKLAAQYWRLMVKGKDYVERGVKEYKKQVYRSKVRALKRLNKELNINY